MTTILALALLSACGDLGQQNVDACEQYYAALVCGEFDLTADAATECPNFRETSCDLVAYFECLEAEFVCDEETGIPDFTAQVVCEGLEVCDEG